MATLVVAPSSPIPSISISFAPPEEIPAEPFSPFDNIAFPVSSPQELDSPRAMHLLPPMTGTPRHSSPLSAGGRKAAPANGKGLDRARFESLLRSTRERALSQAAQQLQAQQQQQQQQRSAVPSPALDLRKQAALKAHKSKQAERRALFLSKIEAPPSPSATDVPVTPPDSPAVLHYSLPSPGLESPISLFETLALVEPQQKRPGWIEHVEFNAPKIVLPLSPRKPMPSLDQISARITSQHKQMQMQQQQKQQQQQQPAGPKRVRLPMGAGAAPVPVRAPIPLPAFLRTPQRTPSPPSPREQAIPVSPAAPARMQLPSLAGHITRGPTPPPAPHPRFNERVTVLPAPSPRTARSRRASEIGATNAVTQANLTMLESRNEMSRAMLEKIMRRVSSPAELERAGRRKGEIFGEHRVLAMPGGF